MSKVVVAATLVDVPPAPRALRRVGRDRAPAARAQHGEQALSGHSNQPGPHLGDNQEGGLT
jgi:hypothetical protein